MTQRQEKALKLFEQGFNCCQAVVGVFGEKYGLSEEMALKVSGGFGGGVRCGDICGAASGGVMVVGLKHGQSSPQDTDAKQTCAAKTVEFLNSFRQENGAVRCEDILGFNPNTSEGRKKADAEREVYRKICVEKVASSVRILEELGY